MFPLNPQPLLVVEGRVTEFLLARQKHEIRLNIACKEEEEEGEKKLQQNVKGEKNTNSEMEGKQIHQQQNAYVNKKTKTSQRQ